MEEQKKESGSKRSEVGRRLCTGAGILIFAAIILGLLFWKNPFTALNIDASSGDLESVTGRIEHFPYVRVENMDLQYTGFYSVDAGENVCGYYYIGSIGNGSCFVEMAAENGQDVQDTLSGCTLKGQWTDASGIIAKAAESEDMTPVEYMDMYGIHEKMILTYDTRQEADFLIYAIAALAGIGCILLGRIV